MLVSNKKWFEHYLLLRRIAIMMMFVYLLLLLQPNWLSETLTCWLQYGSIAFILVLLLFNFVHSPSFFEIERNEDNDELKLRLYFPDLGHWVRFSERYVTNLTIYSNQTVLFSVQKTFLPFIQKGYFQITESEGDKTNVKPINLSWASDFDIQNIQRIIEKHNHRHHHQNT